MSIEVSALVRPSRIGRLLLAGAGLAQLVAALAVGLWLHEHFFGAPLQALALACTGAVLVAAAARRPKTHRIDISGLGDLRVTVQQDVARRPGAAEDDLGAALPAQALLPGSVIWPVLMLVRYGTPDTLATRAQVLPVWRDAVDAAAWRALAVALAVAGRRGQAQDAKIH